MGKITFARVDSRLIHGQIVTKWAKSSGANTIYIIDDMVRSDEFSMDIYMASGKRYGFQVKVYSIAEALTAWEQDQFGKDNVFVLFKTVSTALACLTKGLPLPCLNLGGIPKRKGAEFFIKNVALTEEELSQLRQIAKDDGIKIYAQTVPDSAKKML
jgi:D-glucosaminate-specific PTS system IIB component